MGVTRWKTFWSAEDSTQNLPEALLAGHRTNHVARCITANIVLALLVLLTPLAFRCTDGRESNNDHVYSSDVLCTAIDTANMETML